MMKNFVQKLTGLDSKAIALRFVLMFGVISLFADFTYEGSRSIVGPYLAQLGREAWHTQARFRLSASAYKKTRTHARSREVWF
jgi:hypothetical protein